jgi:hypothetical protein
VDGTDKVSVSFQEWLEEIHEFLPDEQLTASTKLAGRILSIEFYFLMKTPLIFRPFSMNDSNALPWQA